MFERPTSPRSDQIAVVVEKQVPSVTEKGESSSAKGKELQY